MTATRRVSRARPPAHGCAARNCMWLIACALQLIGCGPDPANRSVIATRDRMAFESEVLPILLRDCSFHACHGDQQRFFQVFGPGHGRLSLATKPLDPITPDEVERSYQRSLSMIDNAAPRQSLLLRKPLSVSAGGAGHRGDDRRGRDVYSSRADPNFKLIEDWVMQNQSAPRDGG